MADPPGVSRQRLARAMRARPVPLGLACLLLAAEAPAHRPRDPGSEDELDAWLAGQLSGLDSLADGLSDPRDPDARVGVLRERLAGFSGTERDFSDLGASLLPDVLRRRHGLPILLSVVWLEVAERAGIPAFGVAAPGRFLVGVGPPGAPGSRLVDPFAGGAGAAPGVSPDPDPAPGTVVILRILTNISAWAQRAREPRTELWAAECGLLVPHHPVVLRHHRAGALLRLGRFVDAAQEFTRFAEAVEPADPQGAERAYAQARRARSQLN